MLQGVVSGSATAFLWSGELPDTISAQVFADPSLLPRQCESTGICAGGSVWGAVWALSPGDVSGLCCHPAGMTQGKMASLT